MPSRTGHVDTARWDAPMLEEQLPYLVTLVTVPSAGASVVVAVLGGASAVEDVFIVLLAPILLPVLVVPD